MEKLTAKSSSPPSTDPSGRETLLAPLRLAGVSEVGSAAEVFEAVQRAKAGANAFCTNFFPVESRLQAWIEHREVFVLTARDLSVFLRIDRGFYHFYFCAANPGALADGLKSISGLAEVPMVSDLVGVESAVRPLLAVFEGSDWTPYRRLVRLSRTAGTVPPPLTDVRSEVSEAGPEESAEVLRAIEENFDSYADQLPTGYEVLAALAKGQVLVCRASRPGAAAGSEIGALLFFETQGFTSSIRYWAVAPGYRDRGFGSALIRHYFGSQPGVRRFILWVGAENENAINKYRHYGYQTESLVDEVLVSRALVK